MKKFLVPVTVHVRQIVSVDAYVAIKAKSMAEAKKKVEAAQDDHETLLANSKIQADVDHVQYALENCTTEGIYDAISRNDIAGIDLNPEEIEEDEE